MEFYASHILVAALSLMLGAALFILLQPSTRGTARPSSLPPSDWRETDELPDSFTGEDDVPFESTYDDFEGSDSAIGKTAVVLDQLAELSLSKTDYRRTVQAGLMGHHRKRKPSKDPKPRGFVPLKIRER